MKILRQTGQFKKDLKRYAHRPAKLQKLSDILKLLKNGQPIPDVNRPHLLTGDYKGCMECHVDGDFLLIWIDEVADVVGLLRLGSHSELFGKGTKR